MRSRCLKPLLQNQRSLTLLPLYLNTWLWINKMPNEHSVDPYPSPLKLNERCMLSYFYRSLSALLLSTFSLNFFSKLYIPPWLEEIFKFIVFRLIKNTFASQKIESGHFYSCSLPLRQNSVLCFYHHCPGSGKLLTFPGNVSSKTYYPSRKGDGWGRLGR